MELVGSKPVYDIDSYTRGILGLKYQNKYTSNKIVIEKYNIIVDAKHDHNPANDAKIYFNFMLDC